MTARPLTVDDVDQVGARVTVTLHRGLGTLTGTLEAVGEVSEWPSVRPFALVALDDGSTLEARLADVQLEPRRA